MTNFSRKYSVESVEELANIDLDTLVAHIDSMKNDLSYKLSSFDRSELKRVIPIYIKAIMERSK
jgi:hypothetical protein